jgi:glucan phosphoethanolaminetransferase (alkaline phosphatase superfamily)
MPLYRPLPDLGENHMAQKPEYIPGVCNIGPAEIRMRRMAGWAGLGATVLLWALFFIFRVPAAWRLLLFLPAAMSAVGFLQAAMHFCAAFGVMGVFNLGPNVGKTDSIEQAEFRTKDRQKALLIILISCLIGIAAAVAGYLLVLP